VLLNRRRINRWAKVSAALLAFVFAVSFVIGGVGSGLDVNWANLWGGGGGASGAASASSPEDQLAQYEETLQTEPNNYEALLGAANQSAALGRTDQEISYLERAVEVQPGVDLYKRLANIYSTGDVPDNEAVVRVLNQATALDPADAESFLQLGAAQRNLGNTSAAILAWNRYLELAPDSEMADTVQQQIDQLSGQAGADETTTTAGAGGASDGSTTTSTAE
jgi:tetratricopeptide (TPR) repeat protein